MERDLKHYDSMGSHGFPEHIKILLLIQLFPDAEAKAMKMKFTLGEKVFANIRDSVLTYAT